MGVAEGRVEDYLTTEVKKLGGLCLKLWGYKGIPDRLVLLPGTHAIFCELKAQNGVVAPAQLVVAGGLRKRGFIVELIFCKDDVDQMLYRAMGAQDEQ